MRSEQHKIGQNFDMGMRMADDAEPGVRSGQLINPPSIRHSVEGSRTALPRTAENHGLVP